LLGRLAAIRAERHRLGDLVKASLECEHQLFEDWKADPLSEDKKLLWVKQRQASKYAAAELERANTAFLDALNELSM
jgi:hypothetical protein